ncbi:MAG: response regulator [Candidatus Dadabacteria bacterium]|nr:MAG: response regulator [Candidatus Dadabacteria bacterium]
MLKDLLATDGFDVVGEAANGEEAVQLYHELKPDLVTMDVMMPRMNGVEATRAILSEDRNARIVMVSSVGQESLIAEALEAGARAYVLKPFSRDDVLAATRRSLEDR